MSGYFVANNNPSKLGGGAPGHQPQLIGGGANSNSGSGMVGRNFIENELSKNYNLIAPPKKELNLLEQKKVEIFLKRKKPKVVIIAAAKVGGIKANNTYRADFIRENLQIQSNIIHGCHLNNINNLIFINRVIICLC